MARKRRYHPDVAGDLKSAVSYYDDINVDLGNRLRASVRDLFTAITNRPDSYGKIHDELRVALLKRFPYVILFEHHADHVAILGIFHAASDPKDWLKRVQ